MASQSEFLARAYVHAQQAGLSGHAARLAVAQSALETNYGRSAPKNAYFGVKATSSWKGPTQNLRTWEDVGGRRVNIVAPFRAYSSPLESFRDWKKTVAKNWPGVFTAKTFADALKALKPGQPGGYATDRQYASKINSINGKISRSVGTLPDASPLPPQRFQTIASRAVAPTPQSMRTAATLGALPAGGSTRLPDRAYAAPVAPVTRSPLSAIASAINPISSAQAAPMPNRPSVGAVMGTGRITPPSFASARMMAPAPSVPSQSFSQPSAPANLSRQQVSAYRDYGNTRNYAPVDPVPSRAQPTSSFLTSSLPVGQAQPLQQQAAQPTFAPAAPVQGPVQTTVPVQAPPVPQMIAKPVQQRIDEAFAAPAPAPAMPSAMDVYSGQANRGMASDGSTVSRDEYGRTSVSNRFGATTTTNPDGHQMAARGGGISGPIGDPGIRTPDMPGVPQRPSQLGGMVRGGIGTVVGGGLGGMLAGPIGAALGAVVASDLARGRNPIDRLGIGTFTTPVTDQFGFTQQMRFANPKSGGAFPDAPRNPAGGLGGKDSNRSERSMRDISPAAARDIKSGKTGLF